MKAQECHFSYRDSIFKKEMKDKVIITNVFFRLHKKHNFITSYPDLERELDHFSVITAKTIRQAVINIRRSKLPDPSITGNAGSFFKNPVVNKEKAASLRKFFPDLPGYENADGSVKLSAAWLIEECGWKGRKYGKTGTYQKQPLIIVNHGGASGQEIYKCALRIRKAVMNRFAIKLDMEVNIL